MECMHWTRQNRLCSRGINQHQVENGAMPGRGLATGWRAYLSFTMYQSGYKYDM